MKQVGYHGIERRSHRRAPVRLPAQLYGVSSGGRSAEGVTTDLCFGGARLQVESLTCVPREAVSLRLGPGAVPPSPDEMIRGRVCRVETAPERAVAIRFDADGREEFLVPELIGRHPLVLESKRRIPEIAEQDLDVLISGGCGTGKSFVADLLHRLSGRAGERPERLACPALPTGVLGTLLCGIRDPAENDRASRSGLLHRAGSIVLEEVSALPRTVQDLLAAALERIRRRRAVEGERAGSRARILSTTTSDLRQRVSRGAFREDLADRLAGATLALPPLRDRSRDVPLLAEYFHLRFLDEAGRLRRAFTRDELSRLQGRTSQGNVRELENEVRRMVIFGP